MFFLALTIFFLSATSTTKIFSLLALKEISCLCECMTQFPRKISDYISYFIVTTVLIAIQLLNIFSLIPEIWHFFVWLTQNQAVMLFVGLLDQILMCLLITYHLIKTTDKAPLHNNTFNKNFIKLWLTSLVSQTHERKYYFEGLGVIFHLTQYWQCPISIFVRHQWSIKIYIQVSSNFDFNSAICTGKTEDSNVVSPDFSVRETNIFAFNCTSLII